MAYILTLAYFKLGKESLARGALSTAQDCFYKAKNYSEQTAFDTAYIEAILPLYSSISKNIQAPLLEFDEKIYIGGLYDVFDYELYKYVTQDHSYSFKNPLMSKHFRAKEAIKERNYQEAIKYLTEAENMAKTEGYDAVIVFGIYSDLELCYKQLYNFEKAYTYSSKRMSMLEGFKS